MEDPVEDMESDQPQVASYSDSVVIRYTEYTINFEFGQQVPVKSKNSGSSICLGRIVMSPQHTKLFHKILGKVIEDYEKGFHEISLKME
ncbi:MAG: DUF3467 domain-containing protein [Methanoregula sp.]|jgi:hypothetical protein|nr:DUF3467 domain-containing protein [Methanoregula sp.]MDD5188633.1 DUF3467 domain-containing protein [Methanoregula sp.]